MRVRVRVRDVDTLTLTRLGGFKSEEVMERMAGMDPNDPSNTHLHNNDAQRLQSPGRSSEQIFRLHPEHHALNCFGPTDMKKRHKLAVKRWATHRQSQLCLLIPPDSI